MSYVNSKLIGCVCAKAIYHPETREKIIDQLEAITEKHLELLNKLDADTIIVYL